MHSRAWYCLASVTLAAAAVLAQQPPQPTFKTGVQLVRIDVSVLDEKRQPVHGLQASDFTVLEDGRPRPIRSFDAIDHPAATTGAATGAATVSVETATGVTTNQAGNDASRLILIMMDRTIPPERPMFIARQIADAAVDAMAPGDLAAIVTSGNAGTPQNFTSDRARLHKVIASADWSQGLSAAQKDDPIVTKVDLANPLTDGRCMCGLCVLDTITQIANALRGVPRRKVMLFIGSDLIIQTPQQQFLTLGSDVVVTKTDFSCGKRIQDSRERLFEALGASGLTVHSIDPQGLASNGPETRATVVNGVENRDSSDLRRQFTKERSEFLAAQGNLGVLPELTGGRTILNSNEPFHMVPAVLHESDAYYLLAFEPIESIGDVRHTIEVKVARKGVNVHTVKYIEPSAATADAGSTPTSSPLERALTDVLPNASLPLGMAVSTFAGTDRRHAYVGIALDVSSFASDAGAIPLEIAVQASDERGRPVAAGRQKGTVQVPVTGATGLSAFVELHTYLMLPPGDYELRSAVMNPATKAASSVFTHITVPAFDEGALSLSDVVLGTRENAGALPEGAPSLPIVPTTARTFTAGAPAWAFVRAYRPADQTTPVSVETSVLDAGGKRLTHQSLPAASFVDGAADIRLPLPLQGLPAGRYVLRVDARQGRAEASRSVAFEVARTPATLTQAHSPDLDAALAAAARYIDQYEHRVVAIGAEEQYEQAVQSAGTPLTAIDPRAGFGRGGQTVSAAAITASRKTRANIMTIGLGTRGWVSFRDVFELDGHPVRDRVDRLSRVLQHVDPDSLEQARQIAAESARFNLEPQGTRLNRTVNAPMTALYFLRGANQPRSVFTLGKPERVDGVSCTTLQFAEQGRPRLIRTNDDAAAQGTFWIDMANGGRVLKTELRIESALAGQSVRAQSAVTYGRVDKLDLWVPLVMDETYQLPAMRQTLSGHATYSDFREFTVTTSQGIR